MSAFESGSENSNDIDLFQASFDSSEDSNELWEDLIKQLTITHLMELEKHFETAIPPPTPSHQPEKTIKKEAFINAIDNIFGKGKYSLQAVCLFNEINSNENKKSINWNQLLDLIVQISDKSTNNVELTIEKIHTLKNLKRQSIVKIITIQSATTFCYIVLAKYGQVNVYDSKWKLLFQYEAILDERGTTNFKPIRVSRTKWITDAVYCQNIGLMAIASSARCLIFYDVSRLHHAPIWFISGMPNTPKCLLYSFNGETNKSKSFLFFGDNLGFVTKLTFLQPRQIGILPRKPTERLSCYYWQELSAFVDHVVINSSVKVHSDAINHISFDAESSTLITSSTSSKDSLILIHLSGRREINEEHSTIFSIKRGVNCFFFDSRRKTVITGGDDCVVHVWNSLLPSRSIFAMVGHRNAVVDLYVNISLKIIVSYSLDGICKLWHLTEYVCLQTLHLAFAALKPIYGNVVEIERGIESIHPGAPVTIAANSSNSSENEDATTCRTTSDQLISISSIPRFSDLLQDKLCITCCNHVAMVKVHNVADNEVFNEKQNVLSAPALFKKASIPDSWRQIIEKTRNRQNVSMWQSNAKVVDHDEMEKLFHEHEVDDLLKRTYLRPNQRCKVNLKLGKINEIKKKMRSSVSQCTPYMALNLFELSEIKLPPSLCNMSQTKMQKQLMEETRQLLLDVNDIDANKTIRTNSRARNQCLNNIF